MQPIPVQLSVRNVKKSFSGKAGEVRVLDDLSFSINERDFVSIIGPSGCGKTTIFNIIAGLIEPDSGSLHYRGEEIEGTIRAAFYYGAPLAGREIIYQLAGGRTTTAKTDEKGEIHFKFPTRDFHETQTLPLVVTLPERNIRTAQNFFLATQGFSFSLKTVRPVFVAGETFEVTIKATDAEGKPLAQKLALRVLERTVVDGKVGESEVEQHELTTDKEGIARQTLRLEKGAQYILRAEGIDRFKNPVTNQQLVRISDENDQVRLRILADRHTFKVGDTAEVQLHWREAPALALVTFQGARVLDYNLVQLDRGANKFTIPMSAKLAFAACRRAVRSICC